MINDYFLQQMAKAMNSESFVVPAYYAFGTSVVTPAYADTTLLGEFGSRVGLTSVRATASIDFTGTRAGASVTQSTGDTLYGMGVFNPSTNGTLLSEVSLPGILQTTGYDIQIDTTYDFVRG